MAGEHIDERVAAHGDLEMHGHETGVGGEIVRFPKDAIRMETRCAICMGIVKNTVTVMKCLHRCEWHSLVGIYFHVLVRLRYVERAALIFVTNI